MKGKREKTSWVWKLVIINLDNSMNCKPCKEQKGKIHEFKCGGPSKNTTNISRHLDNHHPVEALASKKLHDIEKKKKKSRLN